MRPLSLCRLPSTPERQETCLKKKKAYFLRRTGKNAIEPLNSSKILRDARRLGLRLERDAESTQLRDRLLIQQVPPQDGDFLFCGVVLSWFFQAFSPLS